MSREDGVIDERPVREYGFKFVGGKATAALLALVVGVALALVGVFTVIDGLAFQGYEVRIQEGVYRDVQKGRGEAAHVRYRQGCYLLVAFDSGEREAYVAREKECGY